MRYFDTIIVHCTATPAGRDLHVNDIDLYHKTEGFREIGYHFLIALDGTIEHGRNIDIVGAHCAGHNKDSVGIAYVGGLDKKLRPADTRTKAQKESLRKLIAHLTYLALNNHFGMPRVVGHRDLNPCKVCPCFDAQQEYN